MFYFIPEMRRGMVYHAPVHLADSWAKVVTTCRLHENSPEITVNRVGPELAQAKTTSWKGEILVNHSAFQSI